jgi:hypothetical protein
MYKQKIILFFSLILFSFICPLILSYLLCIKYPRYIPAEYWIKEAITIKEQYIKTITNPKIIIISGSNSLFGVCTPLIKEKTNKEIVNFGLHAALPIEVFFALIKRNAKPNDIILMPLEYTYYKKKNNITSWQANNLTSWGTEFIKEFSSTQFLEILIKSVPSLPNRIKNFNVDLPIHTYEEHMQDKNSSAILSLSSYRNAINNFGEILTDNKSKLKNDVTYAYVNPAGLNDFRFEQLKDFSDYLAKQNIRLILTYPVSMQISDFNLFKKEHLTKIEAVNKKCEGYGLDLIGIPELSNFELPYSFDTEYHLNAEGAILRSLYLADTINCYLAGIPQEIADLEEYKNEKKAEAKKILEEYRKLGYFSE